MSPNDLSRRSGHDAGFTLIEFAIVMAVMASLVGAAVYGIAAVRDDAKRSQTEQAMRRVENALTLFVQRNGRLPCPDTDSTADGGEDGGRNGGCSGTLTGKDGPGVGRVPYATLGIPVGDALDIWGNWLTYAVDDGLVQDTGGDTPHWPLECDDDGFNLTTRESALRVDAMAAGEETTHPAYVLISHGANGLGALSETGDARAAAEEADENTNATVAPDGPWVTPANASGPMDDLVRYRSPNKILVDSGCTLQPRRNPVVAGVGGGRPAGGAGSQAPDQGGGDPGGGDPGGGDPGGGDPGGGDPGGGDPGGGGDGSCAGRAFGNAITATGGGGITINNNAELRNLPSVILPTIGVDGQGADSGCNNATCMPTPDFDGDAARLVIPSAPANPASSGYVLGNDGSASLTGTVAYTSLQMEQNSALTLDGRSGDMTVNVGGGLFAIKQNAVLTVRGDVVIFANQMQIDQNAEIIVASGGSLKVYLTGVLTMNQNATINSSGTSGDLLMMTRNQMNFEQNVIANGYFYADGDIFVKNNAEVTGSLNGRSARLENNAVVTYSDDTPDGIGALCP